jgi:hypothetical protein
MCAKTFKFVLHSWRVKARSFDSLKSSHVRRFLFDMRLVMEQGDDNKLQTFTRTRGIIFFGFDPYSSNLLVE